MAILIITTHKDSSLNHIVSAADSIGDESSVAYYNRLTDGIDGIDFSSQYDTIYFRDPFNTVGFDTSEIKLAIDLVAERYPQARYIDNVKSYDDFMIEDKWQQYRLLSEYMPKTDLLDDVLTFHDGDHIAKPRLSSRGRGIVFVAKDIKPNEQYIRQPIIDIDTEYRVYGVHGQVQDMMAIRSSKTLNSKVKVNGVTTVADEVRAFADIIYKRLSHLQLIGLDIAKTNDGQLILIEVNRSPQFTRYNEMTGSNLADKLLRGLYE